MKFKKYFIIFSLFLIVFLCIAYPFRNKIKRSIKSTIEHFTVSKRTNNSVCPNCKYLFVDNVKKQEGAYALEGIKPQQNKNGLNKLVRMGKLRNVISNEYYIIDDLTHSSPYLMPKAILFLKDLSKLYTNKCNIKSVQLIPFKISSLTRTKTDVKNLMKVNENAIYNSSHLKGKTFDVNYRAFNNNKTQTICFIEALKELRNNNRCFVKFESNGCLHITVI